MVYPLYETNPGDTAEVVWVISEPPMAERLSALGFTSKEPVTCMIKGKKDSMSAYQVRGAVIALRPANAKEVLVRTIEPRP